MARVPNFYSINEVKKPANKRRYHNNSECGPGKEIPKADKRAGTDGYDLCEDCQKK
jgi:hypothetical protein